MKKLEQEKLRQLGAQSENNSLEKGEYPYKVTASIITYNQAEFIENAIEGALKQEVDFPYEIIIGDDGSTDGTREILLEYREKYPDLIKLNLHTEHWDEGIPGRLNNITNIRSAQGRYIAFCDGDDYWLSKDKIQKQAEYLDQNPDYSFCFHDACYKFEEIEQDYFLSEKFFELKNSRRISEKEVAFRNFNISSSSTCFRKKYVANFPDWFWNIHLADYALQLHGLQFGKVYYQKDIQSVRYLNKKSVNQNYIQEKGFLTLYESDINYFRENLNVDKSNYWETESKRWFKKFVEQFKKREILKSFLSLYKAYRSDNKTLIKIYSLVRSRIYRLFNRVLYRG